MTEPAQDLLAGIGVSIIAAAVFALLARHAHQPLILGYIVGGAVLGPHLGLGIVTNEASIELISEMGLILLLFIIGLEVSVPRVIQAGRTITVSGLLQFPVCAALAWWLVVLVVDPRRGGAFDGLYLAVAVSLSSTLIVVKLLSDKLELGTFAGRVTLGVLIFQDLWAIGFLALQPSLRSLEPGPLLGSLGTSVGLVATCGVLSRLVLPRLFRSVARSHELLLITAIAWCFLVAGTAGSLGLSKEMGALIAGMVIAAFPYNTEVISRLGGVRDFFVTLFFVALGMKFAMPSSRMLLLAGAAALFVVLSRFAVIVPLFALLGLDTRTAGVVAINLSQISEFSLVIVTLGVGYGHVSQEVAALVLYTLLFTSVLSTYTILFNHRLATLLARALALLGVPVRSERPPPPAAAPASSREAAGAIFFLGVSREGLAFIRHLEREQPVMKERIVAVDFNPETLDRLRADGVECYYGDVGNAETLRRADIAKASVVVSSISDWLLQGTGNLRLLRQVRSLAPAARVIVTADTVPAAEQLYAEGADYVLIPPVLAAGHLYDLLVDGTAETLAAARRQQADTLRVLPRDPAARR
jgi:Kef-type K+ transport system membrane component KefB/voltage-gated potassium channel Kch